MSLIAVDGGWGVWLWENLSFFSYLSHEKQLAVMNRQNPFIIGQVRGWTTILQGGIEERFPLVDQPSFVPQQD